MRISDWSSDVCSSDLTMQADFPVEAQVKWDWVWKALVWAIFLPLTLRTKLRIESLILIMLLSAGSIAIAGGLKTAAGGSGYGSLQLLHNENFGLYEGSIMSTGGIREEERRVGKKGVSTCR